jgi:hypothetical protein
MERHLQVLDRLAYRQHNEAMVALGRPHWPAGWRRGPRTGQSAAGDGELNDVCSATAG